MLDKSSLVEALNSNVPVKKGQVVMVHSSYKALGGLVEGPNGVIEALLEYVNEDGTLLIPTFNFTSWSNEHYYDILETPSEMGVITEFARARNEFKRTEHPMYSFAIHGKYQRKFLNTLSLTTMGENSVFSLFHELNGLIISIGLDYNDSFTLLHHVELSAKATHRRVKDFAGIYLDENREASLRKYQMYVRASSKFKTFVNPAMEKMESEGVIKTFRLGNTKICYAYANSYYNRCFELVKESPELFYKK